MPEAQLRVRTSREVAYGQVLRGLKPPVEAGLGPGEADGLRHRPGGGRHAGDADGDVCTQWEARQL